MFWYLLVFLIGSCFGFLVSLILCVGLYALFLVWLFENELKSELIHYNEDE